MSLNPTRQGRTYDQTQQIVENRNRLGDNPRDNPDGKDECNPGPDRDQIALLHPGRPAEEAHVDVFASDMAVDDATDHNLNHH
jgi:hypothetical protein